MIMARIKSSKPKKQRKEHYNQPLHRKQQGLAGHLDKKLRQQLGTRSLALRKGDSVKVAVGKKKGTTGKITAVDYEKGVVFVDKLVRKKANGEEIPMPVQASNLIVIDVDKNDAKRFKGKKIEEKAEKKEEEKPAKKEEKKAEKKEEKKE